MPPAESRIRPVPLRGFSLIELLVVIAIIALLIGIIVPSLSGARRAGEQTVCLANLRQIAQASMLYASEHNGASPALGDPWFRAPFWAVVVQQQANPEGESASELYVEDSVLVCPSADRQDGPGLTRTYAVNVTGHAGLPGDRDNFDTGPVFIDTWRVERPDSAPWYFDSAMTAIAGEGPPPTRTVSTLDFRQPEHVENRLGWRHGAQRDGVGTRFDAAMLDGSAEAFEEVGEDWVRPLP
ncbi:MAG: type II secretion system protein [Phycisphaerales bacterium JB040]